MASIFQNKKFDSFGIEILIDGDRFRLYGFPQRRDAVAFKERLEELQVCVKLGNVPAHLKLWLAKLWEKNRFQYHKLAEMGLADAREDCGTIGELIERYKTYAINGQEPKERTSRNRAVASKTLLNFIANQKPGNFHQDRVALRLASERLVNEITPDFVRKFYAYMQKTYRQSTWGRRVKHFKVMFEMAVHAGWISENPFAKLRGSAVVSRSRDFNISPELAQQVLTACPSARWRLLFSFARWGGLRMPSEITFLRWSDIDWTGNRIRICEPKKTRRREQEQGIFSERYIPIFPEIRTALEEFLAETGEKTGEEDFIFPEFLASPSAGALLRKEFREVLRRAGIPPWPKLFVNLRATRATELQGVYPIHKVCAWIGHTPEISLKHYTQVTANDFMEASSFSVSPVQTDRGKDRGKDRGGK